MPQSRSNSHCYDEQLEPLLPCPRCWPKHNTEQPSQKHHILYKLYSYGLRDLMNCQAHSLPVITQQEVDREEAYSPTDSFAEFGGACPRTELFRDEEKDSETCEYNRKHSRRSITLCASK